jgi:deoxyribonuclease-4
LQDKLLEELRFLFISPKTFSTVQENLRIGVHTSISGGVQNAVISQEEKTGNCGQIFSHSPRSWDSPNPSPEDVQAFKSMCQSKDIKPWVIHASYLVNLCTPKDNLGTKSRNSMQDEVEVASKLGIPYVNVHLGAHTGAGVEQGLQNAADRIDSLDVPDDVTVVVETDAGGGTRLGGQFEHLRKVDDMTDKRLEFCLDTAHTWAAGYPLSTHKDVLRMFEEFGDVVGLDKLSIIHLNDSKHGIATNKDEHQHLGEGEIGYNGIKSVLKFGVKNDLFFIMETPITEHKNDRDNLSVARKMLSED